MKLKMLLVAAVLSFSSLSLAADDPNAPFVAAFMKQTEVQEVLLELKTNDPTLTEDNITVTPISGGCGFAGCDLNVLVTLELSHHGTNTYFTTVSALFHRAAVGNVITFKKLVEIEK